MDRLPYVILIFIAGLCWPLQAAFNGELKSRVDQPLFAAMTSCAGAVIIAGFILLIFGMLMGRTHIPTTAQITSVPWWAWLGGTCSVIIIVAQSTTARPLGAALMVTIFLAGQVISGVIFDQFGLMKYEVRQITPTRAIGVLCVLFGIAFLWYDASHPKS